MVLAGCADAEENTSRPRDGRFAHAALEQALGALASRPAITYSSVASGLSEDDKFALEPQGHETIHLTVTRTGVIYGTGSTTRSPFELLAVDGRLYLFADAAEWEALGVTPDRAAEFAHRWNLVDPSDIGFDPSELTPTRAAETLRLASAHSRSMLELELENEEVIRFTTDSGVIDVTATEPHRIIHSDVPLGREEQGTRAAGLAFVANADTTIENTTVEELRRVLEALEDALDKIKESYVFIPEMQLSHSGDSFSCTRGACVFTTQVTNRIEAKYQVATEVRVTMNVTMNGGLLGTRTCSANMTMPPDSTSPISCAASFPDQAAGPRRTYDIRSRAHVFAKAVFVPNEPAIFQKIQEDFLKMMEATE